VSETEVQAAPVVKVASNLSQIVRLYEGLMVQAIQRAGAKIDGTSLPGGEPMVALAGVAEQWKNARRIALHEERHMATCQRLDHTRCWTGSEDEDDTEPPLQTMLFWSEQWRDQHGYPLEGRRPTVATEANVLRSLLGWAWDNLIEWDDFARDIATTKTRLENMLMAGVRSERGAPCLYESCRGARLVRKLVPRGDAEGHKTWVLTDWHCPRCKRSWDEDRYAAMVTAAHERTKFEEIDGVTWCSDEYAARKVGRSVKTIRTWINRGDLPTVCLIAGRRTRFVPLGEVEARHEKAKRRGVA
jgi:hypothetical protein